MVLAVESGFGEGASAPFSFGGLGWGYLNEAVGIFALSAGD